MNYIANQYALAVFSLACEQNTEKAFLSEWTKIIDSLDENTLKFFIHPGISKNDKKQVVDHSIENTLVKNLLFVLIDNRRLDLLQAIATEYLQLLNNRQKILEVKVYSKNALTNDQILNLKEKLAKEHQREIKIINQMDSNIIAGIKLEYEGYIVDETLNRQLDDLKTHLKK
jgi:F-type H+-transporting ATPase subunit delta